MSLDVPASRAAANLAPRTIPPRRRPHRGLGLLSTFLPALVALAALVSLSACEEVKKGAEAEQQIAAEQAIIRAYAAKVPDVDTKLAAFLSAWERANEQRDLKSLKDDLSANVKPAVAAHIEALAAMPTGSPALEKIHAPLVAAYREAAIAFDVFIGAVTEDTLDAEYAKLIAAMDKVSLAEETYGAALKDYYAQHRMTLTAPVGANPGKAP